MLDKGKSNKRMDWTPSLDKIGQNNGIGTGTGTSIIQQVKTNIADIDLSRGLALKIKKEKFDLNYSASAIRLKKVLDELERPGEEVEVFLEAINIHCLERK